MFSTKITKVHSISISNVVEIKCNSKCRKIYKQENSKTFYYDQI